MGGLGPGIGGLEYVVIAIVALVVVGPERLPALLNKLGKMVAKARNMANEFRASFDELARQSELDDLRREVEALRQGQSNMMPLGPDAEATFRDIRDGMNRPLLDAPTTEPAADPETASPRPARGKRPAAKPKATAKAKPTTAAKPRPAAKPKPKPKARPKGDAS